MLVKFQRNESRDGGPHSMVSVFIGPELGRLQCAGMLAFASDEWQTFKSEHLDDAGYLVRRESGKGGQHDQSE